MSSMTLTIAPPNSRNVLKYEVIVQYASITSSLYVPFDSKYLVANNSEVITLIIMVVGLVPIPIQPRYFLDGLSSGFEITAKNESSISIPCAGNCLYSAA